MPLQHIHKLLGYGLTDVETTGKKFKDKRLSKDGIVFCKDVEDEYHLIHFFNTLVKTEKEKGDKWRIPRYSMVHYQPYIYDCVHLLPANGIIAIVPPDKASFWHRKDDIIDAVIESEFFSKEVNCGAINGNIPPHTDFMNKITGKVLDYEEVVIYRDKFQRLQESPTNKARKQLEISLDESAKRMGFENMLDANLNMAPAIPDMVVEFVKWLKIFNQPETIYQLRPITLSYWD